MNKLVILLLSIYLVSCGNYYTQKNDWKSFENKLITDIGNKKEELEKIQFGKLDTIKLRSKISVEKFHYSKNRLPLVFINTIKNSLYIFNRENPYQYKLIITDFNFEKCTILTNFGEDY